MDIQGLKSRLNIVCINMSISVMLLFGLCIPYMFSKLPEMNNYSAVLVTVLFVAIVVNLLLGIISLETVIKKIGNKKSWT